MNLKLTSQQAALSFDEYQTDIQAHVEKKNH